MVRYNAVCYFQKRVSHDGNGRASDHARPVAGAFLAVSGKIPELHAGRSRCHGGKLDFSVSKRRFLRSVVFSQDVNQTQTMISRVSEVMHFLGHAYHSLSDIILKVRTPPPRALLCRPILIQQSAVVQTGFPIQLEVV